MVTDQTEIDDVNDNLEIIDNLHLDDDVAAKVAAELNNPLGLVHDIKYTGAYLLVRWPDYDDQDE